METCGHGLILQLIIVPDESLQPDRGERTCYPTSSTVETRPTHPSLLRPSPDNSTGNNVLVSPPCPLQLMRKLCVIFIIFQPNPEVLEG